MSQPLPPLRWTRLYSVGHPALDAQHRKLFVLINDLVGLQQADATAQRQAVIDTLPRLGKYAERHFKAEELLMARAGAAQLEEHREKHRALLAQVQQLQRTIDAGKQPPFHELLLFLRYWLAEHILVTDKRYAPAMAKLLIAGELSEAAAEQAAEAELW